MHHKVKSNVHFVLKILPF